jgi:hypothetical protein
MSYFTLGLATAIFVYIFYVWAFKKKVEHVPFIISLALAVSVVTVIAIWTRA